MIEQRTPPPPESQKHQADYANTKIQEMSIAAAKYHWEKNNTLQAVELLEHLHRFNRNATFGKFSFILLTFSSHVNLFFTPSFSIGSYLKIEKYSLKNLLDLKVLEVCQ